VMVPKPPACAPLISAALNGRNEAEESLRCEGVVRSYSKVSSTMQRVGRHATGELLRAGPRDPWCGGAASVSS
jgi:hypothetical protein